MSRSLNREIGLSDRDAIKKACENGTLRIAFMVVSSGGVKLEHEYFVENGSGKFDVFTAEGKPI